MANSTYLILSHAPPLHFFSDAAFTRRSSFERHEAAGLLFARAVHGMLRTPSFASDRRIARRSAGSSHRTSSRRPPARKSRNRRRAADPPRKTR